MRGHREPLRRAAPARTDWDRDRGPPPRTSRRSRSRSPIKSKLMAMAMSSNRDKDRKVNSSRNDHDNNDRAAQSRRLRMDEQRPRSPEHRRFDSGHKKGVANLDKAVKKAREERNNYWDKKILEAEEKHPERWGHSGFKEMYHKNDSKPSSQKRPRSRSGSTPRRTKRSRSPSFRVHKPHSRSFSRSTSRSPVNRLIAAKSRKHQPHRHVSRSLSPVPSSSKFRSDANNAKGQKANNNSKSLRDLGRSHVTSKGSLPLVKKKLTNLKSGGIVRKGMPPRRSSSFSSSDSSLSRSRSRSYQTPTKRSTGNRLLTKIKAKPGMSSYSSSSSSSDEDVLQLHAKGKHRTSSFSHSESDSSSSSRSRSRSIAGMKRKDVKVTVSSSSSETLSSSESDSDISIRAKPKPLLPVGNKPKVTNKVVKKIAPTSAPLADKSKIKSPVKATLPAAVPKKMVKKPTVVAPKAAPATTVASAAKPKPVISKPNSTLPAKEKGNIASKKGTKSPSESGETETDSSDSDSEPRMTLSERFAKLSQLSTDKREMAKPVLAVNEIDTKMRVVKDFRNPEAPKTYVAGENRSASAEKIKPRPRSLTPPSHPENFDRRDEERRQHFERMYNDTPEDRSLDWSDARVRFNYYKNRGCFDERPITFEEYIKWEDWYHKYREWLAQEAEARRPPPPNSANWNYNGNPGPHRRPEPSPRMRIQPGSNSGFPMSQRLGGIGRQPLTNRTHFGRPEGDTYLQAQQRLGRRIDRTAGGSLVVNVRPYNNGNNGFNARRRLGRPQ